MRPGLAIAETVYHLAMIDEPAIVDVLERAGYRITAPRRAVAELVAGRDGHFTAADLVADARDRHLGIGRATVFRSLELLGDLGVVERLDLPSGEHAYVGCEPSHHHHVVCSRCGRSAAVEIDGGLVATVVRDIARSTGFAVETHRIELFGLCPACLSAS